MVQTVYFPQEDLEVSFGLFGVTEGQVQFLAALLQRIYFDLPFLNQICIFFALIREIDNSSLLFSDTLIESLDLVSNVDDPAFRIFEFKGLFTDD